MCSIENDEDMKIVGDVVDDGRDTTEAWRLHKACGNIDRAHRLGAMMAQHLMSLTDDRAPRLLQKQMLFAFVVDAGCPVLLGDEILAQTARGTFFARLRTLLPDFEDTLHRLGAFTFYRLCLDGNAEDALPAEKIGKVFAALCGDAENVTMEQDGTALFRAYFKRLEETAALVDFHRV